MLKRYSRRSFFTTALASTCAAPIFAVDSVFASASRRTLHLHNFETGEKLSATYWINGEYRIDVLPLFRHILRNPRANPELLDMLYLKQCKKGFGNP